MRKATTVLFVVLMFVFSCTKESVSPDPDSASDVLKGAKLKTKTLKFHESSGTMGGIPCVDCDIYPDCNDCQSGYVFVIQGTGHASHLGAFTVQNYACINPETMDLMEPLNGILTAANGDKIFTMVTKEPYFDDRGLVYYYTILDGTGRFKKANGYIEMWGDINYELGTFYLEGLGEIIY